MYNILTHITCKSLWDRLSIVVKVMTPFITYCFYVHYVSQIGRTVGVVFFVLQLFFILNGFCAWFQVTELQSLMAEKDVILGPDGKIVGNRISRTPKKEQNDNHKEEQTSSSNKLICPTCRLYFVSSFWLCTYLYTTHTICLFVILS